MSRQENGAPDRSGIREFFDRILATPQPERQAVIDLFLVAITVNQSRNTKAAEKICEAIDLLLNPETKERP